jgi:hypothetical protein
LARSRLTDDGRVIITTPGAGYAVGDVLYVIGSAASYGTRLAEGSDRPEADGRQACANVYTQHDVGTVEREHEHPKARQLVTDEPLECNPFRRLFSPRCGPCRDYG